MEEKLTRRRGEYPRPVGVCARYGRKLHRACAPLLVSAPRGPDGYGIPWMMDSSVSSAPLR